MLKTIDAPLAGLKEEARDEGWEDRFDRHYGNPNGFIFLAKPWFDDVKSFIKKEFDSLLDRAVKVERLRAFEILHDELMNCDEGVETLDVLERCQRNILSADNR